MLRYRTPQRWGALRDIPYKRMKKTNGNGDGLYVKNWVCLQKSWGAFVITPSVKFIVSPKSESKIGKAAAVVLASRNVCGTSAKPFFVLTLFAVTTNARKLAIFFLSLE